MKNPVHKKDKKKKDGIVIRGGGRYYGAWDVWVSDRSGSDPSTRDDDVGFRIVRRKKNEKSSP